MAGHAGAIVLMRAARSPPVMRGIEWSVITRSHAVGSVSTARSASTMARAFSTVSARSASPTKAQAGSGLRILAFSSWPRPQTGTIAAKRSAFAAAIAGGFALVEASGGRLTLVEDRFSNLDAVAQSLGHTAVDGILQAQATADAQYFAANCGRALAGDETARIAAHFLKAYRWQYILSGAAHPRFQSILRALVSEPQMERIGAAVLSLS